MISGQRIAGNFVFSDDGDTVYIWTKTSWSAQLKIERADMTPAEFRLVAARMVEMIKLIYGKG